MKNSTDDSYFEPFVDDHPVTTNALVLPSGSFLVVEFLGKRVVFGDDIRQILSFTLEFV